MIEPGEKKAGVEAGEMAPRGDERRMVHQEDQVRMNRSGQEGDSSNNLRLCIDSCNE